MFGVDSSPYLLNATLLKHITSYEREDPEFVNRMLRSLYVDDLSLSLEDVDKAYELYLKSRERMAQGGFNLRKWLTNSRPLMEKIKEIESQREFSIQTERLISSMKMIRDTIESWSAVLKRGMSTPNRTSW